MHFVHGSWPLGVENGCSRFSDKQKPTIVRLPRNAEFRFLFNPVRIQPGLSRAHYVRMLSAVLLIQGLLSGDLRICSTTMLYPEDSISAPSPAMFHEPWGMSPSDWTLAVTCSLHFEQLIYICVNHNTLQKEAPLAKFGSSINIWV